ncbi:MAG: hypothetical protein ACYSW0_19990, partial [Planctomycetota bacterium]
IKYCKNCKKPELVNSQGICNECDENDREATRRSFAFGNVHLSNNKITRLDINRAAEKLSKEKP